MAQFATAADLADRLGLTFSGEEQARADALLTSASGLVQAEARQRIELVEDDALIVRGTVDDRIPLPERPVVSVASVVLDGTPIDGWFLEGNELVRGAVDVFDGLPLLGSAGFGYESQTLVITYTHGFDSIPDAIKAVTLEAAVRAWVNPGSVMRERHGSEGVDYALQGVPSGLLLTDQERRVVRRLCGSRALSVTIR